jgi:hypothetical protein
MRKIISLQTLRFFILISVLIFLIAPLWLEYGVTTAIQATFLVWSLYILCVPAPHGKILIGVPYQIVTGKKLIYPESFMWSTAVLVNIFTYFKAPWLYLTSLPTHLLYRIVSTPWPYWTIILTCGLGTLYKFLIGHKNFEAKKFKHYTTRTLLILIGLFVFLYFSYKELIILINVRA